MLQSIQKMLVLAIMLAFSLVIFPNHAQAFVAFDGQLTATDTCEAVTSIKKGTNPDNLRLQRGQSYNIVAKNNEPASHYLLEIASAQPSQRWVSINCGTVSDKVAGTPPVNPPANPVKPGVGKGNDYLLALSWQPAFCEEKPDKTECKTLAKNPDRPEATHFVLHGLWPQPIGTEYCNVSDSDINFDQAKPNAWSKLPAIEEKLSPQTWANLQAVMPGTASYLQRHEWIKHGTCYPGTPDEYFAEAIALVNTFNNSPLQKLVEQNIGKQVAIKAIDQALSSFGADTGNKVEVKCKKEVLGEVWVNLEGDITLTTPVSKLLENAPPAKGEKFASCLIDRADD
jgi:ribonuclease T2